MHTRGPLGFVYILPLPMSSVPFLNTIPHRDEGEGVLESLQTIRGASRAYHLTPPFRAVLWNFTMNVTQGHPLDQPP